MEARDGLSVCVIFGRQRRVGERSGVEGNVFSVSDVGMAQVVRRSVPAAASPGGSE